MHDPSTTHGTVITYFCVARQLGFNEDFVYITYEYLYCDVSLLCEACTVGLIMYAATVHKLLDYEQS